MSADGKLSDCKIVESSGSDSLDQTTCQLILRRARFTPALDRAGKAVPRITYTGIRWVLPD